MPLYENISFLLYHTKILGVYYAREGIDGSHIQSLGC